MRNRQSAHAVGSVARRCVMNATLGTVAIVAATLLTGCNTYKPGGALAEPRRSRTSPKHTLL